LYRVSRIRRSSGPAPDFEITAKLSIENSHKKIKKKGKEK